ncbi:Uma2 family endonuclease [Hymenobacter rubripertinctus]|uniref:Uma2 family endonuclease n=1 Tax=Hymenobacter rubripertinctus TaxID=2029981 RepID=A0A418R775_9BACT|nr:Uma2 family endonuclease [Hymenobacter rubripertinctus]RIY13323.1 Uma2 family endonuclease [Hymenobacter rubripertinctus]
MPTQPHDTRRYTVEEYLALEEASDVRYEFYHGEIFPLDTLTSRAGGTKRHNLLIQNCVAALRRSLKGRGCSVFAENVRMAVDENQHYNYPDVVVGCDPTDNDPRTVYRPVLIIEVLSASTEARDRGWKFQQYQLVSSLQHYVLVSQRRRLVECYTRTEGGTWLLTSVREPEHTVPLTALQVELTVTAIYEDVETGPEEGSALLRLPD